MRFGKKQARKKKKPLSTEEQKIHKLELKQKRYLDKALVDLAEKDPAFKRQIIAHTFGFSLPDPSVGRQQELDALINDLVISQIKKDPDLAQNIAKAMIFQTMQSKGLAPSNEELRNRPSQMDQAINMAEDVNRLKAAIGIKKPGFLEKILTPDVIQLLIPIIPALLHQQEPTNSPEETVLVEINDEVKEIPLSEYKRLQSERLLQKTGEVESLMEEDQQKDNDMPPPPNIPDNTKGDDQAPLSPESP